MDRNDLFDLNKDDSEESFNQEITEVINFSETENGFASDYMINSDHLEKIMKLKLKLDTKQVFNQPNSLQRLVSKAFSRKNNIFYCFNTEELSVDIKDTTGEVYLPLLTKGEIARRLLTIKPELRKTMNMVHIGAVKILLKAQFRDGINFPIKMALVDNRIINRQDALLGAVQGNLAYGKFMFTVYPKFALHRDSKDFEKTLSFIHQCERTDLMEPGNKVFTINYLISYALTNSTHSIEYKEKESITLDDVFSEIGTVEGSKFAEPSQLQENWAINIAREKQTLGFQPRNSFTGIPLQIRESSSNTEKQLIRSMSEKVDMYGEILREMIGK
uniref:Movement protein n=1 Tax=Dahlia mosaic virus TaxID=213888 RepID=S5G2M5_DMV|nr:movement protein [Dahlia mosaic virus]